MFQDSENEFSIEEGGKKYVRNSLRFSSTTPPEGGHTFHKIGFFTVTVQKRFESTDKELKCILTRTIVTKLSGLDPGPGKSLFRIRESIKHRIPDPDRQHCFF
jgi:hypothetical protein